MFVVCVYFFALCCLQGGIFFFGMYFRRANDFEATMSVRRRSNMSNFQFLSEMADGARGADETFEGEVLQHTF